MLKNILSLLLSKFYSKQENDTISHLATPTINNPVNVTLATDANSVIVAPFDGYLNIETTAEGNPTINVWEALWCNSTPISPAQAKIFVPVTKGQRIQYRITGTISQARFVRLVGGGVSALKNAFLQGGGLCLNSLSSSLRRSFCRVRKNGLLNNGTCRLRMRLLFLFQTTVTCILMFLQRTVCWCWRNLVRQELVTWKSTPLVRDLISISQALEFTKVLQCRLIEAKRFISRQPQITEEIIRSFTSSRLSVKREVGLGGASC